jgi:hypothetical protein
LALVAKREGKRPFGRSRHKGKERDHVEGLGIKGRKETIWKV